MTTASPFSVAEEQKKSSHAQRVLQHLGMKVVNPELSRTLTVIPHSDFYDDDLAPYKKRLKHQMY